MRLLLLPLRLALWMWFRPRRIDMVVHVDANRL
jgi:hypothetical protein